MQSRITRQVRSRGYELDAQASVPPSTMLRYLEYMRWESANEPELGLGRLFQDGYRMVVRAQQLQVQAPVGLDEDLDVSMEFGHVGRASLDMIHQVVRTQDRKPVARAIVTAVYLDPTWRPHPIPDDIRQLASSEERQVLVASPAETRPSDAWHRRVTITNSDLDLFQHMNHARYLDYFNDTRLIAAAAGAYGDASKSAARPFLGASLDYRRQALAGDHLLISTWALSDTTLRLDLHNADGDTYCGTRIELSP